MMLTQRLVTLVLFGSLGFGFPHRPLRSHAADITTDHIRGAAVIAGLELTEAEQQQMVRRLAERWQALTELRRHSVPNALAPALVFDPRPRGFVRPNATAAFNWQPTESPQRPADPAAWMRLNVRELATLLKARQLSSVELTTAVLERLRRYGPALHCVVTVTADRALAAARQADLELAQNRWRGPLHGIPYGVKDLLDVAGEPSTWGIAPRTNEIARRDAAVVRKLDQAGAVLVAKLSLGELAMGDVWYEGITRNPWHPEAGSSGSSAGSASAVAAGLLPFAIGSETLGSIVSPSTVCGVTGLRPSYGRVSRQGAMTLSFSMDKIGPMARTAEDCALVLAAIHGVDGEDRSLIDAPLNAVPAHEAAKLRVGFLQTDFNKSYPNQTNDHAALAVLRSLGWNLVPLTLPAFPKRIFYEMLNAEAAASFDELTRSNADDQLVQQDDGSWPNVFRSARFLSAVDYLQAQRLRQRLLEETQTLFTQVDVLVAPSWQGNQLLWSNVTGLPCVVVPNGPLDGTVRPSLCFLAGLFQEGAAVAVAAAYQSATTWHQQQPDLTKLRGAD